MSEQRQLAGRTIVVTGSSTGIGSAAALEFARRGDSVVVHARGNREAAEATVAAVRACGVDATLLLADLADPAALERFADLDQLVEQPK